MKHYYTEKQLKELLDHLVILVDTREQTSHITEWFDKHKIKYKTKALKTGDYGFMIEACPELGFVRDTYFTDELCIEKKNSLDELAGNFSEKSERFFKELNRMINIENCYILIEKNSMSDLINHKYSSRYNETSFLRGLLSCQKKCNFYLYFVDASDMGRMIYEICRNCLTDKILK